SPVSVTLATSGAAGFAGSATGINLGFAGVDDLVGSTAVDQLTGRDVSSSWTVAASSTYDDGAFTLTFTSFQFLQGRSADDTFDVRPQLQPGRGLPIDGGAPTFAAPAPHDTLNLKIAALVPPAANGTLEVTGAASAIYTTTNYQTLTYSN